MKKALLLALTFLALTSFTRPSFNLVGNWEGSFGGEAYRMEFDAEGYAILQRGKKVMGGKEFKMGAEKGAITYKANYDIQPNTVTFTLHRLLTKDTSPMYTVAFKPVNDNEIITIVAEEGHAPDFTSKGAVVYKRK